MAGLTLDAGALIAFERDDRRLVAILKRAAARGAPVTVPAGVVAQVWRKPPSSRLGQLLGGCRIEPLDDRLARACGELCGRASTSDVVDASVVVGAATRGDAVVTADLADIEMLARHARGIGPVIPLA